MTDFAKFMTINGLKRKDIAAFLGVSGAFITQISSGDRPLPEEKLAIIKANAYGWDISMLTGSSNTLPVENSREALLREFLAQKEQEVNELRKRVWELESLLESKGGTAPGADSSSSVNVG